MQDHRVGDVGHVEFVEADQPETPGHALAQLVQRIDRALQLPQLAMDLPHELMEVQPRLALERDRVVEAVHQEALAAPHPAEHVHAAWHVRPVDQLLQGVGALSLELRPLPGATLQRLDRTQLRGVTGVTPRLEFSFVRLADRGD
jgi:hypothetical protein